MIKHTNKRKSEQKAYNSIFTVNGNFHHVYSISFNTVEMVQSKIWFIMVWDSDTHLIAIILASSLPKPAPKLLISSSVIQELFYVQNQYFLP